VQTDLPAGRYISRLFRVSPKQRESSSRSATPLPIFFSGREGRTECAKVRSSIVARRTYSPDRFIRPVPSRPVPSRLVRSAAKRRVPVVARLFHLSLSLSLSFTRRDKRIGRETNRIGLSRFDNGSLKSANIPLIRGNRPRVYSPPSSPLSLSLSLLSRCSLTIYLPEITRRRIVVVTRHPLGAYSDVLSREC